MYRLFFFKIWNHCPLYLQILFLPISDLPLILWLLLHICWYALWLPTGLWGSVHFSSFFFFLLFILNDLNWPILRILDSFICHFKSVVEPLLWLFHFHHCTFQLQNFCLVLLIISMLFIDLFGLPSSHTLLTFLSIVSFSSLNILTIADLNFCLRYPTYELSLIFFYWLLVIADESYFLVSFHISLFCCELDTFSTIMCQLWESNSSSPQSLLLLVRVVISAAAVICLFCDFPGLIVQSLYSSSCAATEASAQSVVL